MRVAIAAHRLAVRNPTGVDRYVIELVTALAREARVDVTVGAAAERAQPGWLPDGVVARRVRGPRPLVTLAWCLSGRPRVDRAFDHPDLVYGAVPAYPFPARVPVVYYVHDLFPLDEPSWFSRKERFGFKRALEAALAGPAIIVGSAPVAAGLVAAGADSNRVVTIRPGISERFFAAVPTKRGEQPRNDYDLFVGAVTERKNVDILVHALKVAERPLPLLLAGPPSPGLDAVRLLAEQVGVGELVRPVGYVPDTELPALMAGARSLVQPSQAEGFGFTPLEAMAAGTPAVVARTAAFTEVVGDAALVVDDPEDPIAWGSALSTLSDPQTRAAASERGRAHVARFSWTVTAERTVAVWRAVLRGQAPADAFLADIG